MKLLQPVAGTVDRLAPDGSGVIDRPEGKPYLIYNVIPGEEATATVVKRTPDGMRAKLDSVVVASPDRVAPRCPYAGTCGGCKWQHIDYDRQRLEKLNRLRATFAETATDCPVESVLASPDQFYYRNRMDFTFGRNGELGLKMPDKWWAALNLETCYLLSPESVEIVNAVRDWARSTGLPFWDGKSHAGFFRYLVIREGKFTGERMVTLVTKDPAGLKSLGNQEASQEIPRDFSPAGFVAAIGDRATSIVHGINDGITDLSISDVLVPLKGDPFIREEINGVRFKITPNAFFQTNSAMAAKLQDEVVRHVERPSPSKRTRPSSISTAALDSSRSPSRSGPRRSASSASRKTPRRSPAPRKTSPRTPSAPSTSSPRPRTSTGNPTPPTSSSSTRPAPECTRESSRPFSTPRRPRSSTSPANMSVS